MPGWSLVESCSPPVTLVAIASVVVAAATLALSLACRSVILRGSAQLLMGVAVLALAGGLYAAEIRSASHRLDAIPIEDPIVEQEFRDRAEQLARSTIWCGLVGSVLPLALALWTLGFATRDAKAGRPTSASRGRGRGPR